MPKESETRDAASLRVLDELATLGRRGRSSAVLVAHRFDLQPTQVQLLLTLGRATECRVATLAEAQMVDPSVISRQAAGLERLGLITRRPDPEDGRAALISLTDAGRERVRRVRELHVRAVTESMADWPVERIARLADDLDALSAASMDAYSRLSGAPTAEPTKDSV